MNKKYIERGDPTYRKFYIYGIFDTQGEYSKIWEKEIRNKLDSRAS